MSHSRRSRRWTSGPGGSEVELVERGWGEVSPQTDKGSFQGQLLMKKRFDRIVYLSPLSPLLSSPQHLSPSRPSLPPSPPSLVQLLPRAPCRFSQWPPAPFPPLSMYPPNHNPLTSSYQLWSSGLVFYLPKLLPFHQTSIPILVKRPNLCFNWSKVT